jgi:predicted dehydrogenase
MWGDKKIRYAVAGLGHIAQVAVLPAFERSRASELVALVSGSWEKLDVLGDRYGVRHRIHYDDFDGFLRTGAVDAVYLCTPNDKHRDLCVRAAEAGVHVLCEKPLAVTERECEEMLDACERNGVLLMTAYRLHFEPANLRVAELVRSGALGDVRFIESVFSMQVAEGDIRLQRARGGGTLYDLGVYCINAARTLFREEPIEVSALSCGGRSERFLEVDEMSSVVLRFPEDRFAAFTTSFGAANFSEYRVVGSDGWLRVEPAYHYATDLAFEINVRGEQQRHVFPRHDQFAPELDHFSECIRTGAVPEPNGWEGLADVRIVEAAYASAQLHRPVELPPLRTSRRPGMRWAMQRQALDGFDGTRLPGSRG